MNVHALVHARIVSALQALQGAGALPVGLDLANAEVSPPREAAHGDLASNAALVLASQAGMQPREIAARLAAKLRAHADIEAVEVAGAGFLNFHFALGFWHAVVTAILMAGKSFGRVDLGRGERVNVEYGSIDATRPLHLGHARAAVLGDALASLLAFVGYDVTRECYINDSGAQGELLARSAYLRYREALGEDVGEISDPGGALTALGVALAEAHGPALLDLPEEKWLPPVREAAVAATLATIKRDLALLNIRHDVLFSGHSLTAAEDEIGATIEELRRKGLVREGSYTELAADIAYQRNKLGRGFKHLINVLGADRVGCIAPMKAAVAALSDGKVDLDFKVCQAVKLLRAGEPVGASRRGGTLVTLRDLVDEVGPDPVRFMMLYRKNDAALDLDLAKVVEQSKDNPVFYVQYAHARAKSVFRNAREVFPKLKEWGTEVVNSDLSLLSDLGEVGLIKKLALFPAIVEGAACAREPHRLAIYLYDLASSFHGQYARGHDLPHLRFIQPADGTLTAARLALVQANALVLAAGLELLGVLAPLEMR